MALNQIFKLRQVVDSLVIDDIWYLGDGIAKLVTNLLILLSMLAVVMFTDLSALRQSEIPMKWFQKIFHF